MSKAKIHSASSGQAVIKVTEPPKIPTLNFGKRPSIFSGGSGPSARGQFVPPAIRITQNKGGGGK